MQNEWKNLTIDNCGDGALTEDFEKGIKEILADFEEDGKLSTDKRTLSLEVVLYGDTIDDDFINIQVKSKVTLAKRKAHPVRRAMKNTDSETGLDMKVDVQEVLPLVDNVTDIGKQSGE